MTMDFMSPEMDDKIRAALKKADAEDNLGTVAAAVGIAGGVDELRKIMNSEGELNLMDRGMLSMHMGIAQ